MKIKVNTIIPLITLALGVFWIFYGLSNYGFWHPVRGPVTGFVPILISIPLVPVSLIGLIKSFKEPDTPGALENWTIVLAATMTYFLVFIVGMVVALMTFVFIWIKVYEKMPWKQTIICLVIAFVIIYGGFITWLKIPLPNGLIFEAMMG